MTEKTCLAEVQGALCHLKKEIGKARNDAHSLTQWLHNFIEERRVTPSPDELTEMHAIAYRCLSTLRGIDW